MTKNVVIYARLSVSKDESVSIARQIEACRKNAEARDWTVVATVRDDGVSATATKPELRRGWQEILASTDRYDAVIVWKIDRLARRVIDFNNACEALKARKATVVSVEESIDLSTPHGRAMAQIIAVFAELEAAAISSRVHDARDYLLRAGRLPGGTVPYGYQSIKNPAGPGYVLAQDPVTIRYVRSMVEQAASGVSIYAITKWLNDEAAPLPKAAQRNRKREGWSYSTVERILRSPVLAGMIPYNPGNTSKVRGTQVLRDDKGLAVVDPSLRVLTTGQRRQLLAVLDGRESPQRKPRAAKGVTSPLLSGLATCGHCDRTMHRGTSQGREVLSCPGCYQTMTTRQLVPYLAGRLLDERGEWSAFERAPKADDPVAIADIQEAIDEVLRNMSGDQADMPALTEKLAVLKGMRAEAASGASRGIVLRYKGTVRQQWEQASDDLDRRAVLAAEIESLRIVRGKSGRYLDPARVKLTWNPVVNEEQGHEYTYGS